MKVSAVQKSPSTLTTRIARTPGAWPEAEIAANGAAITRLRRLARRGSSCSAARSSLYCSLTTKLEMAPLAAAPRTARALKNWPTELTDWRPTTSATPPRPTTSPALTSAKTVSGKTTVTGKLNSTPNSLFFVQFYSNPSGNEGKKLIGIKSVSTGLDGTTETLTFSPAAPVAVGQAITAAVLDETTKDTSELSAPRTVATS
jgi:hypothetical protein